MHKFRPAPAGAATAERCCLAHRALESLERPEGLCHLRSWTALLLADAILNLLGAWAKVPVGSCHGHPKV